MNTSNPFLDLILPLLISPVLSSINGSLHLSHHSISFACEWLSFSFFRTRHVLKSLNSFRCLIQCNIPYSQKGNLSKPGSSSTLMLKPPSDKIKMASTGVIYWYSVRNDPCTAKNNRGLKDRKEKFRHFLRGLLTVSSRKPYFMYLLFMAFLLILPASKPLIDCYAIPQSLGFKHMMVSQTSSKVKRLSEFTSKTACPQIMTSPHTLGRVVEFLL